MPEFDYGNARLHAMKSRLLTNRELELLASTGSLQGLISILTKTAYQKSVESALTRSSGMECIDDALRNDLAGSVEKVRSFYSGSARKMVAIVLRAYDIHNLKAILRGLSRHAPVGEILKSLLPAGELKYPLLRELAQMRNHREAIDTLASMGQSIVWPLITLRTERPGAQLFELELALERWHYQEARRSLRMENRLEGSLIRALALEADLSNVLTALRFARDPSERELLRDHFGDEQVNCLFIGPGHIPFDRLTDACHQDNVTTAIEALVDTALVPALRAGLKRYEQTQRLSDIEKQLKVYRLKWMVAQMVKDPLGIGVVLGYIAAKTNEVGNIRWIAHGIESGLKAETIREELEMLS